MARFRDVTLTLISLMILVSVLVIAAAAAGLRSAANRPVANPIQPLPVPATSPRWNAVR